MSKNEHNHHIRAMILWAVLFFCAMFAAAGASFVFNLPVWWSILAFMAAMTLMIPYVHSAQKASAEAGSYSPAMTRYNRRFTVMSFAYVVLLLLSVSVFNTYDLSLPALWAIATLPALSVIGMIWAMVRLLQEEQDEYLRLRMTNAALIATAIVLVIGTLWGFFETFGLVPHIWVWAIFPMWAISFAVGRYICRDRP
ncbi:hypothetical protein [Pontixanthobacter sp.]|uniref:hypothetical protein n=1 Tax=Pontixanthobacter sp. TaxID=2792078 RepID=UPI003C7E0188